MLCECRRPPHQQHPHVQHMKYSEDHKTCLQVLTRQYSQSAASRPPPNDPVASPPHLLGTALGRQSEFWRKVSFHKLFSKELYNWWLFCGKRPAKLRFCTWKRFWRQFCTWKSTWKTIRAFPSFFERFFPLLFGDFFSPFGILVCRRDAMEWLLVVSTPEKERNNQQRQSEPWLDGLLQESTLQHITTHCNALQHTATHSNSLQHSTRLCNTLQHAATLALQHSATLCKRLQETATLCNTLQHSATLCNTLQHSATLCNTLNVFTTAAGHSWKVIFLKRAVQLVALLREETCN